MASGKWFYAMVNGEGKLEKSAFLAGKGTPGSVGLRKHLRPREFPPREGRSPQKESKAALWPTPSSVKDATDWLAAKGDQPAAPSTLKNLVILARFADHTTLFSRSDFEDLFNQTGYFTDGAYGSVREYFLQASHGALSIESTVTEWVTLPEDEAYYAANDSYGGDLRRRQMAKDAIQALNDTGFDFSAFDEDGDGLVDMVTIIHSGLGEEYMANPDGCMWSHMATFWPYVRVDGVAVSQYCTAPERRYDTGHLIRIGVICHEMGHLLGLPDLYDTDLSSAGIAVWGLMGFGNWGGDGTSPERPVHLCCWSKLQLGWLTPTDLVSSDPRVIVPAIEETTSPMVYRLSREMAGGEYLLIENRQRKGYDARLLDGGLLIWHIDDNKPDNDNESDHYKVALLQADGKRDLERSFGWGDSGDPFPGSSDNRSLTPESSPSSDSYDLGDTGIWITEISEPADEMTFSLSLGGPPPANQPPQISITSVLQRSDGSGHLEVAFVGVDIESDPTLWAPSDCQYSLQPYSDWRPLEFDTADPGHTAREPMAFLPAGESFVAVIDASEWDGVYKIRLGVTDGIDPSSSALSDEFLVDNSPPALLATTHLDDPHPQSGTRSVTSSASWTDLGIDTTYFLLRINQEEWGPPVCGSPTGESLQSAVFNSFTLDGDDCLSVKSFHVDDWGNRSRESISPAYYVAPATPLAPGVDAPTPNSLVVVVAPNPDEAGAVDYAVSCPTADKYVDCSTGTLVDAPVWGSLNNWNGGRGVTVVGLSSKTWYSFAVIAANPLNRQVMSEASDPTLGMTANTPPNPPQNVELTPAAPLTTTEIKCTVTPAVPPDPEPEDTVSYLYTWTNSTRTLAVGPTAALTDTLSASETSKGEVWSCTVIASDGEAASDQIGGWVTIHNSAPALEVTGSLATYPFCRMALTITAQDADDDALYLSCENVPEGASFSDFGNGEASFEWLPTSSGEYDGICFVASDGDTSSSYPVSISVSPTSFEIAYIGLEPVLGDKRLLSIMWFGVPGASYSVFRSQDLLMWECVGSGISLPAESEQGDWLCYREELSSSSNALSFYRVAME